MKSIVNLNMKLVASFFAVITTLISTPALAEANRAVAELDNMDFSELLGMRKTLVDTHVSITWDDGTPVVGAKVFEHRNNTLLGITNSDGKLLLSVLNGTLLRLVEPDYGQQQSLRIVQGKKKGAQEMAIAPGSSEYSVIMAEGWSL